MRAPGAPPPPSQRRRRPATAEQAQLARNDGKLRKAHAELLICTAMECPAELRSDCATWAKQVDAAMARLVPHVTDARGREVLGVRVLVDGEPVAERVDGRGIDVDPGVH